MVNASIKYHQSILIHQNNGFNSQRLSHHLVPDQFTSFMRITGLSPALLWLQALPVGSLTQGCHQSFDFASAGDLISEGSLPGRGTFWTWQTPKLHHGKGEYEPIYNPYLSHVSRVCPRGIYEHIHYLRCSVVLWCPKRYSREWMSYQCTNGGIELVYHWWYVHLGFLKMVDPQNGGSPIAGLFIMENPIKMDDLGIPPF